VERNARSSREKGGEKMNVRYEYVFKKYILEFFAQNDRSALL